MIHNLGNPELVAYPNLAALAANDIRSISLDELKKEYCYSDCY
jgi:hypothetical protein